MKKFQTKIQNKKCMGASKVQCASETTSRTLLAEKTLHKLEICIRWKESWVTGWECCRLLSVFLAADLQYAPERF